MWVETKTVSECGHMDEEREGERGGVIQDYQANKSEGGKERNEMDRMEK